MLQLLVAKTSLADRSSYETWRQNELQQRCNKNEQYAEQYRSQRVSFFNFSLTSYEFDSLLMTWHQ